MVSVDSDHAKMSVWVIPYDSQYLDKWHLANFLSLATEQRNHRNQCKQLPLVVDCITKEEVLIELSLLTWYDDFERNKILSQLCLHILAEYLLILVCLSSMLWKIIWFFRFVTKSRWLNLSHANVLLRVTSQLSQLSFCDLYTYKIFESAFRNRDVIKEKFCDKYDFSINTRKNCCWCNCSICP